VAQRLVRVNCAHCVEDYIPTLEEAAAFRDRKGPGGERRRSPRSCVSRARDQKRHSFNSEC
jgi:type II secretory ATPase GspE/PulE/Tfp pilus assembly ATPase PilB-like protein